MPLAIYNNLYNSASSVVDSSRLTSKNTLPLLERLSTGLIRKDEGDGLREARTSISAAANWLSQNASTGATQAVNDAVSSATVASAGLNNISEHLQLLRELAAQSANGILSDEDRQAFAGGAESLKNEVNRLAGTSEFAGQKLLDGSFKKEIQVGGEKQTLAIGGADTASLGIADIDLSTAEGAQSAFEKIDSALKTVGSQQAEIAGFQERVESAASGLSGSFGAASGGYAYEVIAAAAESARLAHSEILRNADTAMLAQANANLSSQAVKALLTG